jgi:anti-sigma-K factor RskA
MDYARPERADLLAAHYVAGTLRGAARHRFEALLPGHPALRQAVVAWQARLMPLTGVIEPEAPPPQVWQRIEAQLWPAPPAAAAAPLTQALSFWRGLAGLASVAVLALLVWLANPAPLPAPLVIVLEATPDAPPGDNAFVASVSGDGRALVARPLQPVSVQSDRVLELWSVPPQGAPRSLGLISSQGVTVLPRERLPKALLEGATDALAVSVEPPGGSPTGTPTGPVVYAGKLRL